MTNPFHKLRQRASEIEQQLADLDHQAALLRGEKEELAVAERVLLRFGDGDLHMTSSFKTKIAGLDPKPGNIPHMTHMIESVLEDKRTMLGPADVRKEIAARWWPGVKIENVGPIMWRMWKQGKLIKEGTRYGLLIQGILA